MSGGSLSTTLTSIQDRYTLQQPPGPSTLQVPVASVGMTPVRGILLPQVDAGRQLPLDRAVIFQFNPDEVTYSKTNNWAAHQRTGFPADIPFWVLGGAKTISFKLWLDATAGSNYRIFPKSASGNQNMNASGGPYVNFNDYNVTLSGQGTDGLWPEIQKLEAMQYPINKKTNDLVSFKNGLPDTLSLGKFSNPPFVVFNYGNLYAVVFVRDLNRRDIHFNQYLNPDRCEFDVVLSVQEYRTVDPNMIVSPVGKSLPYQTNDTAPQQSMA